MSAFMDFFQHLIQMASVFTTLAFHQSIQCCSCHIHCDAVVDITSHSCTVHFCSVTRTFNVLLDSPL